MTIQIKRIYDDPSPSDGYRVLVDRLWPRGKRKADARIDEWVKELAPSDELRKWFGHDPDKWEAFRRRYLKELSDMKEEVMSVVQRSGRKTLTLLFAAQDTDPVSYTHLRAHET